MLRLASLFLIGALQLATQKGATMPFSLQSNAFKDGADIPRQYTCEGADMSPALAWTEPPAGTQTFALIADDPDAPAGTWVHWVAWNIAPDSRQLAESVPKSAELAAGLRQGRNDFNKTGYGGPCPPPGKAHRYFFKLYALDSKVDLKPDAGKKELEQAMKGHVLAQAQLMGKYRRGR